MMIKLKNLPHWGHLPEDSITNMCYIIHLDQLQEGLRAHTEYGKIAVIYVL
jgi:hypothetical protein